MSEANCVVIFYATGRFHYHPSHLICQLIPICFFTNYFLDQVKHFRSFLNNLKYPKIFETTFC